jgi:beta-lactamase regulating signal transducer with metallopeptidase domain
MNAIQRLDPAHLLQSDFSIRLTQALLHFLWQAAAIGLLAVVLNHCLRKSSSRLRYGVNVAALLLMLACLPVTFAVVSPPPQSQLTRTEPNRPTPAVRRSGVGTTPSGQIVTQRRDGNEESAIAPVPATAKPASGGFESVAVQTSDASVGSTDATEVTLSSRMTIAAPYTATLYLLGVAAMLFRVLIALRGGHRLRCDSLPIEEQSLLAAVAAQAQRIGLKTVPDVAWCARVSVPVVVGILRPMVLLPASLTTGLSPQQLQALLTHELAHIRRYDLFVNLLQRLAESLLFFHPAVWYVSRRLSDERENCCDDLVLASGCQRIEYADALVHMAELCFAGKARKAAALAASGDRPSQFKRRVLRVLGVSTGSQVRLNRAALFSMAVVPAALLFAMAVLPGWAESPTAVATQSGPQGSAAARKRPLKRSNPASKSEKKRKPASKNYTYEITVTGRAIDQKGKPIAGAKIYLASRRVEWKRLAETTTNKDGRYAFEDVALPIERATDRRGIDYGAFEVFGQAPGYGFAWRPEKTFAPKGLPKEPKNLIRRGDEDLPTGYSPKDKIVLDLKFPPPARLGGRIVDDREKPVGGAELVILSCDPVPTGGYRSEQELNTFHQTRDLKCINEQSTVPPEMKIRKTNAKGRFEFTGMPPNCRLWIFIRATGFPVHRIFAATQNGAKKFHGGLPLYTDGMKITFATPRNVPIQVVYGDTGKPAPNVAVYGTVQNYSLYLQKLSDAYGRVTLRLPAGQRRLILYPATGTPYLLTKLPLTVRDKPDAKPTVVRLKRAAEVEVTVRDADTGKGIAGVDLWREQEHIDSNGTAHTFRGLHEFRSIEIKPKYKISHVHRPVTTANGKMRALFEPGQHRIGIALERFPKGYKPIEKDGVDVDCKAGKTIRVTFHMRKAMLGR